jgi:hypothetical protein
MPINEQELTPEQKVQRQISAMGDSVWLINKLITEDEHTEEIHDTVDRNVRHLEIMLGKSEIQNAGSDLTSFNTAITDGKAFITVSIPTP